MFARAMRMLRTRDIPMTNELFTSLLRQVHDGNTNAMEPIYNEYYGLMVLTAMSVTRNKADAEDAASAAILKIIRYAQSNDDIHIDSVSGFLLTAVRNAAKDVYNTEKKYVHPETMPETPVDPMRRIYDKMVVNEALLSLPEELREIAVLHYYYDRKVREVAKELQMPDGTVKSKLKDARDRMARFLS